MRDVVEDEIDLLVKFYRRMKEKNIQFIDAYRWMEKEETRILKSLESKMIIIRGKSKGIFLLTAKAVKILSCYGYVDEVAEELSIFLINSQGKIEWKNEELIEYANKNNLSEWEFTFIINFGIGLGFLSITGNAMGQRYPNIMITVDGEIYINEPYSFIDYIDLEKREFKKKYKDQIILRFLKEYEYESESSEIEFKSKAHLNEIKNTIASFANHESGIVGIGFDNQGNLGDINDLDLQKQTIAQAITELDGLKQTDVKIRSLRNEDGRIGIIVLVPKTRDVVFIGDSVIGRIEGITRSLSKKQTIELLKHKQKTQYGHLWIKSLHYFVKTSEE